MEQEAGESIHAMHQIASDHFAVNRSIQKGIQDDE
jgi:hypothetical protein